MRDFNYQGQIRVIAARYWDQTINEKIKNKVSLRAGCLR